MHPDHLRFADLKRLVSIHAVLAREGLHSALKTYPNRLVGPCPVHGGDNPHAFVVTLSKNLWHCFTRCGGGDVVALVRRLKSCTWLQTAQYLSSLVGVTPPPLPTGSLAAGTAPFRPFTRRLPLDHRTPWLRAKGIEPLTAMRFQAGAYQGSGFLAHCIGVRLHDHRGLPLGYAGRRLCLQQIRRFGKWKLPRGLPKATILYGFHHLRPVANHTLVIVEGPWGVMRLAQLGIPAIALLGTHLSPEQHRLLRHVPHLTLMLDGDTAGRQATARMVGTLGDSACVRQVNLPPGMDPDDLPDTSLAALTAPLLL